MVPITNLKITGLSDSIDVCPACVVMSLTSQSNWSYFATYWIISSHKLSCILSGHLSWFDSFYILIERFLKSYHLNIKCAHSRPKTNSKSRTQNWCAFKIIVASKLCYVLWYYLVLLTKKEVCFPLENARGVHPQYKV